MINSSRSLIFIYISVMLFACSGDGDGSGNLGDDDQGNGGNQTTGSFSLNTIGDKSVLASESLSFTLSVSSHWQQYYLHL